MEQHGGQPNRIEETAQPARARRERPARRRMGRAWFFVLKWAVLLLVVAGAAVGLWAYVRSNLLPGAKVDANLADAFPDSLSGLLPDATLGYNALDFQNIVLGETREKRDLVVMEQDVQIDTTITQTLANIALFAKTKNVHSYGTGVYTVDLSGLMGESIAVDMENEIVAITIPHAALTYVEVDVDKTEFEDTQRGLLAFTEITMTPEHQRLLTAMIEDAMRARLTEEALLNAADESARTNVRAILQPLVSSVSDDFIVQVVTE